MQPEIPPPPAQYVPYVPQPPPPRSGMPVWGWILIGCLGCGLVIVPILAAILFPVFSQARSSARRASCLSNEKQIALGNLMYVQDYDERFPIASDWQTGVSPYIKNDRIFHCPEVLAGTEQSAPAGTNYAFHNVLDKMKAARLAEPRDTVLIYDSTAFNQNANDALTSLPSPGRHKAGNNLSFADGHAKSWPDSEPLPKGNILPDTPDLK